MQVLAVHIKSCVEQQSSGDDYDLHGEGSPDIMMVESIPEESTPGTSTTMTLNTAACPVCQVEFPMDYLEVHASACGDSVEEMPSRVEDVSKCAAEEIQNLDDVMRAIAHAVYTDGKNFDITVSRQSMFERGLVQWQRQEKASPANQLRVLFLGDAGIDIRALRKEFLTGMIAGIEQKLFEKGSNGGRPNYSLSDLDKGHFRTVGEIMASSLAQGGPAPNFIVLWCYKVLCTGYLNFDNLDKDNVGDAQYADLLTRVEAATETTIQSLTEEILNCGYTGLIHVEKREEIIRATVLHTHLRLLPILLQIRDGLKLYGLLEIMAKYPGICQPLFVPGLEMKADADFIISVCQADFSERGTNREHLEVTLMNHLQDFLQELEQDEVESEVEASGPQLTVEAFLQWITGQGHVPVLQEEKIRIKVNVKFEHHCKSHFGEHRICYPNVAACINTITFPVKHMTTFKDFKEVLVEAFHLAQEFSKV